jgi:hypothetical protein
LRGSSKRKKTLKASWPVGLLCVAFMAACGYWREEALLEQFFAASRLRDKTALRNIATVAFEPADQGIVTRFVVTSVTAEEGDARLVSKNVTVAAPVRSFSGQIRQKRIFLTLQRSDGGPWMITGVTVVGASP